MNVRTEGDEDERAEAEMAALTLYHHRHLQRGQKFSQRIPSMLCKALLIAMAAALLPWLHAQFPALINYLRRALLTRTWDIVNLILVGLAVSYGVLSRGREPERDSDASDSYVAKLFEFGGTFADYVDQGEEPNAGAPEEEEEPNTESPLKIYASGSAYGRPRPSSGEGIAEPEVNFGSPVVSEKDLSVDEAKRRHSAPPPPPPPAALSVENRPTRKDSNPGPRPEIPERKHPILPPPPPPRPPPPPLPPPQVWCSANVVQIAAGAENLQKSDKVGKSEESEKKIPSPSPAPPTVLESVLPPKHGSKHRRSKSKEDSKPRSKDESKHRSAGKDIANALGLFSQSEKKQAKIPPPPAPPPPTPLPSALQQWFSSYRRESRHRSKDSEPSPRPRSERAHRKVHSSSSPPSPPPLPPPPRLPPVYTVDAVSASNFLLKPARDGASVSTDSSKPRRDETSGSKDSSRTTRDVASASRDSSKPRKNESCGSRDSSRATRDGSSGSKESSRPGMDETPGSRDSSKAAAGDGTSGIRDSSKPRKDDMVGAASVVKTGEKSARRRSTSSIPLPPPPPPPFAIGEEHWSLHDLAKYQKRSSSPVVLWEESAASEPEPEHEPQPDIRRQVSLNSIESQFCPSPSPDEVNRKADAFIARFHEQIRLQRVNSIRERLDRGPR